MFGWKRKRDGVKLPSVMWYKGVELSGCYNLSPVIVFQCKFLSQGVEFLKGPDTT